MIVVLAVNIGRRNIEGETIWGSGYRGQQGFRACGIYRQGRVGVPTTQENALDEKSPRCSNRWIREGELLYIKWMETREVSVCTGVHPVYSGRLFSVGRRKVMGAVRGSPSPDPQLWESTTST